MYWKSNLYRLLPLVHILLFFGFSDLQAQTCDGADGLFPPLSGNTVIANGDICANTAVLPYRWEITYTNVDDSGNPNAVEFFVDWNDGTTQVLTLGGGDDFVQQTGVSSYRAVATHFFPAGGGDVKCEYIPVVSLRINGTTCPSTVQNPAPVVRWNTDNENTGNLELSEEVTSNVIFEVCAGETATVRFIDRSEFNCIPANFPGFPPNIRTRWFQFIYGGDPINNTITGSGITINTNTGSNPEGAGNINLLGGATYTSQVVERVQPIDAPTEFTFDITVPADAQIGEEFAITLNNWNACNPYRTAGSPTGNMPVQFTGLIRIIDSPAAPGNTPQDYCAGQPNILSVVPNSGGFITWYSDAALTNVISTGATLNAQTDPPAANRVNNTVPGVYTYYATETLGNNCEGPAATVSFEIFENPAPANAGVDQTICNVVSTLNATPPTVGIGQWQVLSGPGIVTNPNLFNSAVTNLTSQTVLQWRVVNGICESFDAVTINIDTTPDTANAGADQTVCSDSFNLLANTPSSGNGNWSVISGNGVFSDSSDPNATVSALAIGTNILRWTISNTCSANFDEMTIVNNMPGPANAGPDQSVCSNSTNLNASPLVVGAGTWTFITDDGLGNIADPTAINSIFTGTPGFTYTLEWTVANGVCADNMDQVVITFEENPSPANAGPNQVICGNSTTLEGSPVLIGTGLWTEISGDGNGVFSNDSDPLSQFTGTQGINYTLQWTISNGSCVPSTSQVTIQLDDQATQAVAGPDQVICGNSTILQGNTIAVGTGTWSEISGDGAANFVNVNDPVTTFSGTIGVTYQLAWSSANGSCPTTQDIVIIQLDPAADIANAGTDLIICGNSTPLGANLPAIGSGSWSVTSGDPFGSFSNVNDPVSNFSGTAGQTYILRWTISSGSCAPTLDEVQVQFDEAPTNALAGISKTVCGDNTLLDANYPVVGTGMWSLLTNPDSQGIFTDSSDPKTSFSGTPGQSYDLRWTISNGVCAASFQDITVSFDAFPSTPDAGADQVICANTTNLQALAPISGTGIWSLVSNPDGLGTVSNPNSNTSPFTGSYGVEYVLRWTVSNGVCSPLFDDVMVKIGPILNAVVINGPSEACLGDIVNYTIPGADPSLYNYIWDLSGIPPTVNAIPGSGNPFQFISLKVDESFVGTVSVAIQDKSSGCIGPVTSVPLQVFDKPDVVLTSSDIDKFVCQNEEVVFTATDLNGVATQYEFVLNGTVVQSGPSNTYIAKALAVGNSMVVRAFNGICPSSSTTPLVHVVNLNPVAFTVLGGGDICEGEV
ncbi:MAG: hypothetical protein OEW75_12390, partial [Cyclobacteriaceae bacterium]|nr:hypothetical protein [Cyclobacteriaceae bacterium]